MIKMGVNRVLCWFR